MPLPIQKVNTEETKTKSFTDLSCLLGPTTSPTTKIVTASDKDADLLMKIWTQSEKIKDYTYKISSELSSYEFARLKTRGLVSGNSNECQITSRGQKIITVMTLGESNSFLKTQKKKSYTEILASNTVKEKSGYRIPKTSGTNSAKQVNKTANSCTISCKDSLIKITRDEWHYMGETMGWIK